jgi:membrane protein DedA with SNARE-associated domain
MFHDLLVLWMSWVEDWGYAGVVILMAMESSIFPVPSELVIPPAVMHDNMSLVGVIVSGTFGSWLGSSITYGVARWLGRPIVMKWGKFFFMPPAKVEKAEVFMQKYEVGGIFFARLLPVIRHLISIPAGLVRMNFWIFSLVTVLGSLTWCTVLAWCGQWVKEKNPGVMNSPEELIAAVKAESHMIIIGVVILALLYFGMLALTRKSRTEGTEPAQGE